MGRKEETKTRVKGGGRRNERDEIGMIKGRLRNVVYTVRRRTIRETSETGLWNRGCKMDQVKE